jgi:hypothetical protein
MMHGQKNIKFWMSGLSCRQGQSSVVYWVRTGCWSHPASYPVGTSAMWVKAAGRLGLLLTCIYWRGLAIVWRALFHSTPTHAVETVIPGNIFKKANVRD